MGIRGVVKAAGIAGVAAAGLFAGLAAGRGGRAARRLTQKLHGDWQGRLKAEHDVIRKLLKEMIATDFGEGAKRAALVAKVSEVIDRHALEEETVIYPALAQSGGDAEDLFEDHADVKVRLRRLADTAPEDPDWEKQARALRKRLNAHMRIEEKGLFPALHAAEGDDGNRRLTEQMSRQSARL